VDSIHASCLQEGYPFQSATCTKTSRADRSATLNLSALCPPGQPFKIKHIPSYWFALAIARATPSLYNLSHPERKCFFRVQYGKTFTC